MSIVVELGVSQYAELERRSRKSKSVVERCRSRILLLLADGYSVEEVTELVGCVRSTVYRTLYRFEDMGLDGMVDGRSRRGPCKVTADIRSALLKYLDHAPKDFGWQRSSWTLELLALQLECEHHVIVTPSYVGKILRQEKCRRGRPRPALRIPIAGRRTVLKQIKQIIGRADAEGEVFYVDEADIDLNPRIGLTYIKPGQQLLVLTPGKNVKYYIAGALNARTGKLIYAHGPCKNSSLFCALLETLAHHYRRTRRIHLIADNYIVHKSGRTQRMLHDLGGRVQIHFLPPYSPDDNRIERLWKQMHDNITRNHRHATMHGLWEDVEAFLHNVQPFPGTKVSTLKEVA